MKEILRKSGIDVLGDVPWGTHVCQFYEAKEGLLETIVPYMKAGLRGNEMCVWVISPVITREEAVRSLDKELPGVDELIRKGQLEIATPDDIYLRGGSFDADKALRCWGERLEKALAAGYEGLRVTGDTSMLEEKDWPDFDEYEKAADSAIVKVRMLAVCTYDRRRYGTNDLINAFASHAYALVMSDGSWKLVESSERRRAEEARRDNERLLQEIMDGSPSMVFLKDLEGRFITINKQVEKIAGIPLEMIKGKTDFDIVPKEMADYYREHDRQARESGKAVQMEENVDCADGKRRVFLANKFPLFDSSGRMHATCGISHDITERKETEEKLRESEERYRGLYESISDGIARCDMKGKLLDCNQAYLDMLGYTKDEVLKLTRQQLTPAKWHEADVERVKNQVMVRGHCELFEKEYIRKDGTVFPISLKAWLIKNAEGTPIGMWAIIRDITEQKKAGEKLLESEQRYRGLFESIKDGIVRTDLDGNFLDCNQAFLDMLGYTHKEILKLSYKQITPAKWLNVSDDKIRNHIVARGYSDLYEKEYIRKDGSICSISIRAWLIRDAEGNPAEMWGIIRDISEEKKAAEDIRKLNEELKENVAKLEDANMELEAFNFSLAHDLSTPLRVIDGFSKMIEKYYSEKLDEEGREFIRTIRGSAQKMGEFISDLLHLSRLGKSEIIKRPLDMSGLAKPLSDELKTVVPGRDIEFRIKELPVALGEQTLIRQVFFNLMDNALKFTRPRSKAVIEVGGYGNGNENVYYVKDNGVGFDMKHAGRVFGVFKRLHTDREFEGTGAGLAIVQRIIQRHGGRVWVESEPDKGATFYFSLPNL